MTLSNTLVNSVKALLGKPLSVKAKLVALLLSFLLILLVSGYFMQTALNRTVDAIRDQALQIERLHQANIVARQVIRLRSQYIDFLSAPDDESFADLEARADAINEALASLKEPFPEKARHVSGQLEYLHEVSRAVKEAEVPGTVAATQAKGSMSRFSDIHKAIAEMEQDLEGALSLSGEQTRAQTDVLQFMPLIFELGGFLFLLFGLAVLVFDIFRPVRNVTNAMLKASDDTAHTERYLLPVRREDEIGQVAEALNRLLVAVAKARQRSMEVEKELIEAGRYSQAIIDNVVDALVIVDDMGTIESFSPSAEEVFGYKAEEVQGKNVRVLLGDGFEKAYLHQENAPAGRLAELTAFHADGRRIPIELAVGNAAFEGRVIHVMSLRDITSRKRIQTMLEKAQRMEIVGRMTGGIAHDFNNLLTVISGNLELMGRRLEGRRLKDKERWLDMIETVMESVDHGRGLTQRLLAFSRRQVLQPELIDLNEKMPDIIKLVRQIVEEDIELHLKLSEGLGNISVDPVQLESSLLNLCINARDAMPPQGGKIMIETHKQVLSNEDVAGVVLLDEGESLQPGSYVVVSVTDTGKGIPDEIKSQVFEPFFTTKDVGEGTGLGLSMVYGFTRQSGGYVTLYSADGKGTTIKLYFPEARQEESAAFHKGLKDLAQEELKPLPRGNERILVVEDEPGVLSFIASTLSELGYDVKTAGNGPEALGKADNMNSLDLLLTDVVMPGGMNGEALAEQLKGRFKKIKVIYISGYTRDALIEEGSLKSDVTLISKPFTSSQIAREVRTVLDREKTGSSEEELV